MSSEAQVLHQEHPTKQGQWLLVTVTSIDKGVPPRLAFTSLMTLRNGNPKHCSSTALVTNDVLLQRLYAEVQPGEKIRVRIKTNWEVEGIPTILEDFCLV